MYAVAERASTARTETTIICRHFVLTIDLFRTQHAFFFFINPRSVDPLTLQSSSSLLKLCCRLRPRPRPVLTASESISDSDSESIPNRTDRALTSEYLWRS